MAIINYESLTNGQQIAFTTGDVLRFNDPAITPLIIRIRAEPAGPGGVPPQRTQVNVDHPTHADIYLTINAGTLSSANFDFASGGAVIIGDNTAASSDPGPDDQGNALAGTPFDDYFLTGAGDDASLGLEGDDAFELRPSDNILNGPIGKYGHDTIDGGEGSDWLILFNTPFLTAVTVDLIAGTMTGGGPDSSLTLISIENVDGPNATNDTILGSDGANNLGGGGGNDLVSGRDGDDVLFGDSGSDTLDGGEGEDTAVFDDSSASPVAANLSAGMVTNDGMGGSDVLISIENLVGGGGGDNLVGDERDNRLAGEGGNDTLDGGAGDDRLIGGAGDDRLIGGAGNDILDGGLGQDVAVLNGAQADYALSLDDSGLVRAERIDGTDLDLLIGVETLAFTDNPNVSLNPATLGPGATLRRTFADGLDVRVGRFAADRLSDQSVILVWQESDGPSSSYGIFAQRLDADGRTPIGQAFRVNGTLAGNQERPGVAALPDGGYVVTWNSNNLNADTNTGEIFARRFAFDGTPLAAEQRINLVTTGHQYLARVEYIEADNQVSVAWTSGVANGEFLTGNRFTLTATGLAPVGATEGPLPGFDFRANAPGTFASPSVRSFEDFGDGSTAAGINVSHSAGGAFVQGDALARIRFPDGSSAPAVVLESGASVDSSGAYLIPVSETSMFAVWSEDPASGDAVVRMARINQGESAFSTPEQIGTDGLFPSGARLADGTMLVVWTDASGEGIVARWLGAEGTPLTPQFVIVASAPGRQLLAPQVVPLENGNALIVYNVREADGAIPFPIFRQFAEGFESVLVRPVDLATNLPLIQGGDGAEALTDASAGASELAGGGGADTLNAGVGDDRLDGGAGADRMDGGTGNDLYVVDDPGDVLVEGAGAGSGEDSVEVLIDEFTLPDNVENLRFIGADDVSGTGNGADNGIVAGAGDDSLEGAGGDDIVLAGGGNDSVAGGDGEDLIDGGGGVDTAVFEGSQDDYSAVRIILGGTGAFTFSGATAKEMVLLSDSQGRTDRMLNVERVRFDDGEAPLTGNAAFASLRVIRADRYIQDDEAPSALKGGAKADVIDGLDGDDTLQGGAGNDLLLGRGGLDTLFGEAGNDVLDGGAGADTLNGGAGNDLYIIDVTPGASLDTIVEAATGGTDTISTQLAQFDLASSVIGALNIEALEYIGNAGFTGTGNERANLIRGGGGGDSLAGGAGADRLVGLGGADTLDGGSGADRMEGGAGNDTYLVERVASADGVVPGDVVFEGATAAADTGGIDTVRSTVSYTLGLNIENLVLLDGLSLNTSGTGNGGNNSLTGNSGNNVLTGGAGNDIFFASGGNDRFVGGAGNDTLDLSSVLAFAGKGALDPGGFSVSRLDTSTVVITVVGGQLFTIVGPWGATSGTERGIESFVFSDQTVTLQVLLQNTPSAFADELIGTAGADSLAGGAGNDTLDGGADADTLNGGAGNDTYLVDSAGDVIQDSAGTDLIRTALATYSLADKAAIERLVYTGDDDFEGTGNAAANTLSGGAGADTLDGGAGADRLEGGAGDDIYVVNVVASADGLTPGDVVVEAAGAGTDTVRSSVTYTLGANLERLELIGNSAISGTGNGDANFLTGNAGSNVLTGLGGNDTFFASGGNDRFVGGAGADTLDLTSLAFTSTQKNVAGGYSVMRTDASTVVITALEGGQKFTLTGAWAAGSADRGIESFVFSDATLTLDQLLENSGGFGADTLTGGAGADVLAGGAGNDVYVVNGALDQAIEAAGQGTDTIRTALGTYTLPVNVERLEYIGDAEFSGIGGAGSQTLVGGAGNDELDGGAGADTLIGGAGNDTYLVGAGDVVVEAAGGGTDTARSSVTHTLAANVDNLVLADGLAIHGTGNNDANTLTGNELGNSLSGGAGADTLIGGLGNDTLNGGAGTDLAAFAGAQADWQFQQVGASVRATGPDGETDTLIGIEQVRFGAADPVNLSELVAQVGLLRVPAPPHVVPAMVYPEAEGARWNLGSPLGTPATVTYSFMTTVPQYSAASAHPGFQAFTAAQQAAVREILAQYAAVANITFQEVSDGGAGGQLRFGRDQQADSLGYSYIGNAQSFAPMGDVWLAVDASENLQLAPGQIGRYVLMHEIGHALGLDHSEDLPGSEDSQRFTVMSYNDIAGGFFAHTPMTYDIAALQALYGPRMTHNAGNTHYAFAPGEAHRTVWDGGGADTFDFSAFATPVQIDLRPGAVSTAGAEVGIGIAYSVAIEHARGGSGADAITGNSANNTLDGGAGADTLTGGAGADTFVFGAALGAGNVDTITDFTHGTDRIRLDDAIFAQSVFGEHLLYDQASGELRYDADGAGGEDAVLFVVLGVSLHPSLTATDFQIA